MANLLRMRVSTDQRPTARQNLVLHEAGIADPVVFEEDGGTSSRLRPLQRPKFRDVLTYAQPGDTVHISGMFRLVRGTGHILDVLGVFHRDQVALRIHDGAFCAMDLTARTRAPASCCPPWSSWRRPSPPPADSSGNWPATDCAPPRPGAARADAAPP
ncbi:recombinase family protein [Streptomyces sp. AGS-58]|uniref:recombinase family protein n=1 Tax=unclassified Streptomyces TaxID=2593676 RepID=UPI0035A33F41